MAQRTILTASLVLAILAAPTYPGSAATAQAAPAPTADQIAFHSLQQDVAIATLLAELKASAPERRLIIRDVQVVDPDAGTVTPGLSVLV